MNYKIFSITTILLLIVFTILLFQIKIPLCYNTFEEPKETYVLYDTQIIEQVKENIRQSSFHYVSIIGNSMSPNIKNGDMCVCLPQENYQKGDIISFYVPVNDQVELIIHRIIEENNNQFLTKGDANNIIDSWELTNDQIFCKVPEKNLFDKFKFAIGSERFSIFSIFG